MMSTTHALMGVLATAPLLVVAPAEAGTAALAAAAGGAFPDVDAAVGAHRKTLHDPLYYWVLSLPAVALAALLPAAWTLALAAFLVGAAVHCVADIFGGGLGLRPWLVDDDHGVYDHRTARWIPPRRWIRYDGAPEDLALAAALAVPVWLLYDGPVRTVAVAAVLVSVVYAAVRKRLPDWAPEWMT